MQPSKVVLIFSGFLTGYSMGNEENVLFSVRGELLYYFIDVIMFWKLNGC